MSPTMQEIEAGIDQANEENRRVAQKEFTRETGAELAINCNWLLGETNERMAIVERAGVPMEFGAMDRDSIARVLNADMSLSYDGYTTAYAEYDGAAKGGDWRDYAEETPLETVADEACERNAFIDRYEQYLYLAASYAKSLGATAAMRLYLMAWRTVKLTASVYTRQILTPDEALRAVNCEMRATRLLIIEAEAARLPPFKPKRSAKTRKTATKRKKKA